MLLAGSHPRLRSRALPALVALVALVVLVVLSALFLVLPSTSRAQSPSSENQPRSQFQLGGFVALKAGFNLGNSVLTASRVSLNTLPELGAVFQIACDERHSAVLAFDLGLGTFSTQTNVAALTGVVSPTQLSMNTQLRYASAGATVWLEELIGFGFAAGLPLGGEYVSNVDVFGAGTVSPNSPATTRYAFARELLRSSLEARLSANVVKFSLGTGMVNVTLQAAYTLSPLAIVPDDITASAIDRNIVGLDPLAGLRSLALQPVSVALRVQYLLDL
jgi:hypothetical protein